MNTTWKPRVEVGKFAGVKTEEETDITNELLADLHNLASCFGTEDSEEQVKRFFARSPNGVITVGVSMIEGNYSMLVASGQMMGPNPLTLNVMGDDNIPCHVIIDRELTAELLQTLIVNTDERASESDGIVDGQRQNLQLSIQPPKMEVNIIFAEPGACIPVLPQEGDTKETVFNRAKHTILSFDKPEELVVMDHPMSGITIIRKVHLEHIQAREKVAKDLFEERGIDPQNLGDMATEDIVALRTEIDERLKALPETS